MMSDYDFLFKFLLIGDSGVGKSTLMTKICDGNFTETHISTIGVDFKIKTIDVNFDGSEKSCKLQIWDTAGQERFRTITSSYYRGAHGIFICFDLCDAASYTNAKEVWQKEIQTYAKEDVVVMLVGTKKDQVLEDSSRREVSFEEAKIYADSQGMDYVELSSKTDDQDELSETVFNPIVKRIRKADPSAGCRPGTSGSEKEKAPGKGFSLRMRRGGDGGCPGCVIS